MGKRRNEAAPGPGPRRYEIQFTRSAERGLDGLPAAAKQRVDAKIGALADDPRPPGSKKLQGIEELYRVRVGDYRVLYQIEEDRLIVLIVDVGNRRDIYRNL